MTAPDTTQPRASWRQRTYEIIFEADTVAGKVFDIALLALIILSVFAVMLESVEPIRAQYGDTLIAAEWVFTLLFTTEYICRLITVPHPLRYARSFFGIIDLLAVLPTYVAILLPGAQGLIVIRAIRLIRVFRIFKLVRYVGEAGALNRALRSSRHKITVFIITLLTIIPTVGTVMFIIEGPEHGFTSIPQSSYWTIVTMTTVGYGDVAPHTVAGKIVASFVMILGYGIIAVPTGIVTAELTRDRDRPVTTRTCTSCMTEGHAIDAKFCSHCGKPLGEPKP